MKKITILYLFVMLFIYSSFSQQILYDDFESYEAGTKIAGQSETDNWTTWSGATGGAEDGLITEEVAFEESLNSLNITTNNDVVLLFNDLISGRYRLDFQIYIEEGKEGYFNLLQDFAGSNSEWAMQTYFYTDETGSVDAGGAATGEFEYEANTWLYFNFFIDLDNDFATMLIDNEEIVSWKWSGGTSGAGTLKKLDAANFYGWSDESSCKYFIDNIEFTQIETAEAPQNLVLDALDNDISLTWDAPTSGTPDYYSIVRNDIVVASGLTELSYYDENVYPGEYHYSAIAFYSDLGYSAPSNEEMTEIAGGVERDLVVFEIVTGTWCQFCPGAAMGAEDLENSGADVAIVEYHGGDDWEIPASTSRIQYYGVSSYPTTIVDGKYIYSGGSSNQSLFPAYSQLYGTAKSIPGIYILDIEIQDLEENNYKLIVDIEETNSYNEGDLIAHVVLTESHIAESWQGQTELNSVVLAMFPDAYGTSLDFSSSLTQNFEIDFSLTDENQLENCEIIVFVQNPATKEIFQASKLNIAEATTRIDNISSNYDIEIYPNPSNGIFKISTVQNNSEIVVYEISGKKVFNAQLNENINSIDLSHLNKGVYIISVQSEDKFINQKLIIE